MLIRLWNSILKIMKRKIRSISVIKRILFLEIKDILIPCHHLIHYLVMAATLDGILLQMK